MNIFPNRKCYTNFNNKFNQKKNNVILKKKIESFPSLKIYKDLNTQLLKKYLKITLETKIESKKYKTSPTIIKNKDSLIDLNITLPKNNQHLYLLPIKEKKPMFEYLQLIDLINKNIKFDFLTQEKANNVIKTNTLDSIELINIVKPIFKDILKTKATTNFCNVWIFGEKISIFIQGTYIPTSEGTYSEDDYLDLIVDINPKSLTTLTSDDIIGTIDLNKENEGLYFLLFK